MEDAVKAVMVKQVVVCTPEITLQNAVRIMQKKNVTCLVVLKGKAPVGIITERDVMFKAVVNNSDSSKVLVKQIMTSPVKVIKPDDKIYYANNILLKEGIKRLPVVKNNKLVGILTQKDLLRYFTQLRKTLALDKFGKSIKSA